MDESFKDKEYGRVETLLGLLAKKGYILRSELEAIARGCRYHGFTLRDLEEIMSRCLEKPVAYIDDTAFSRDLQLCIQLQKELEKQEEEDLFKYLELSSDATLEDIRLALQKRRNGTCDGYLVQLADRDALETYILLLRTGAVLEQLALRQEFGITKLRRSEFEALLEETLLLSFADERRARQLLQGYLQAMDFSVEPDLTMTKEHKALRDPYLLGLEALPEEAGKSEEINQAEGRNYGRS